ncbi:uncharacterized protein EKO05_0004066 [Ascochyta rabiei]|uniref:Uncharacterized protein n=1 Tax=Didymella rabiei TaxID=5454 RepID=A0A162XNK5_DIDRA|nr:uncharacterized protein EKO05_0004066 [Ascochyta rabiei]KZM19629.1 hypothetical protein ST47_g9248 [Ascochyta rabiei]UPX13561.1 hypothetical protein EKO05_0004066 [Ascochyta rabiei]
MTDEAESSRAALRHDDSSPDHIDSADADPEELARERVKDARERRLDAKRKRIRMLGDLLRELDLVVYMELLALYHLDCSFFWFALRALAHGSLLTPVSDPTMQRPPDEPRPFLPVVTGLFAVNFLLHMLYPAPSAGEDTRGYLHGGLMIDFIGQQGPTSKWKLGGLDLCILVLQLIMVSAHAKRRDLKTQFKRISAGEAPSSNAADAPNTNTDTAGDNAAAAAISETTARGQDADDEERGELRRTDTMSDIGAESEEADALLQSTSETGHVDALDLLSSGQCVILSAGVVDTIWHENENYRAFRQTRTESGLSGDMPETLRRLNTLRARLGVGGG